MVDVAMHKPLIILDRDGVINHDSPHYVRSVSEWIPIDGSIEGIVKLCRAGFEVVVATNQAGVAKGVFTGEELDRMHSKLRALVEQAGGQIARIYDCRHHPADHCDCRKPQPGMLSQACSDFNQTPQDVYFVGDSLNDMKAAWRAGCKPLLVLTGNGSKTRQSSEFDPGIPVIASLAEAADWFASNSNTRTLESRP